ncbi:MAG TPA: ABC transporter permease [Actinomycetales bacterium]|nr:ABC transporter permease [Actinomycetales bacterium]
MTVPTGTLAAGAGSPLVDVDSTASRIALVAVLLTCAGLAAAVNVAGGLGQAAAVLRASGRAVLQLLAVAVVVTAVLSSLPLTVAFLALMSTVASATAGRRLTRDVSGAWCALPVLVAAVPVLLLLVGVRLVPATGTALVPVGGILIGGAMTATVLAGRRALDAISTRYGEYEAGLALGLDRRDAALLVARDDAALALLPGLDQTRTVGLVTLPGAFVGMLLGGATPAEAAAVQLVVLVALLLVQSTAVLVVLELVAGGRLRDPRRRGVAR